MGVRTLLREFILLELKLADIEKRLESPKFLRALESIKSNLRLDTIYTDIDVMREMILTTPPESLSENDRMLAANWIISRIIDGGITKDHIRDDLGAGLKISEYLKAFFVGNRHLEIKDLNQVESVQHLYNLVMTHLGRDRVAPVDPLRVKGATWANRDDRFEVFIAHTGQAACELGRGTEWCTAKYPWTDERNAADRYLKDGKLLVVFDKRTGERYPALDGIFR